MHSLGPQQYWRLAAGYRRNAELQPQDLRERTLVHVARLEKLAQEVEVLELQALKDELARLPSKQKLCVFADRLGIEIEDEVIERVKEDLRNEIFCRLLKLRSASSFS